MKRLTQLFSIMLLGLVMTTVACNSTTKEQKAETNEPVATSHDEWTKDAVIYEVNVRQFTEEGTFKAFMPHMERLSNMGVDILWFMPVHPIGVENRKGTLGSYYAVKDYKAINPEFGTIEDFRAIVEKAHSLGMKVQIDWVANHTAWDNQWIYDHPEYYKKDSTGNMFAPFDWSDVCQLDYDNTDLHEAMIDALEFWVRDLDIDGYRCDVAGMVPVEFWEKATARLNKIKPVFMLAEDEGVVALLDKAFAMNYAWELHHIMNEIAKGHKNTDDLNAYYEKADTVFPHKAYRMNFITNHDENSWNGTVTERMGDAGQMFAVFSYMAPGMPLIYSGQEAGLDHRLEFFEKDVIDWSNIKYESFYKKLGDIRKENPALWGGLHGGKLVRINSNMNDKVFAFVREKDGNKVVSVFNMSAEAVEVTFEDEMLNGEFINYVNKKTQNIKAGEPVKIDAWTSLIMISK
jgi:glycosidase